MGQANLQARFCRASDLKRGMQILSFQGRKPRFMRIKSVKIDGDQVMLKLGKSQVAYLAHQDVHVLDQ